ncbi:MAG: hypothetical protein O7A07_05225 [Acidobacteria bacterium]|nr:hypothetical protein [Acidobacteriota bacterium]
MRRRRNIPRRNRRNRSAPADRSERPAPHQPPPAPPGELYDVEGAVELMRDGSGFLRSSKTCYLATRNDPFIAQQILRKWHLRDGAWIIGKAAVTASGRGNGKPRLQEIETINAMPPEKHLELPEFRQLTSLDPEERLILETTPEELSTRAVDLISPIGRGQRGLIVSPPKAGKTLLL